jgi:hypothetical protein
MQKQTRQIAACLPSRQEIRGVGRSIFDTVRNHPKIAAGLIVFTGLIAVDGVSKINSSLSDPANPQAVVSGADLNSDGRISVSEQITRAEIDEIPRIEDLGPVLGSPIKTKASIAGEKDGSNIPGRIERKYLEQYDPKFVGAYKSTQGIEFNIYAATQPGEDKVLEQEFQVNPQAIEYVLGQIKAHIHDAPNNAAKKATIENLRRLESGELQQVTDLVVDVSPKAGCLDESTQLAAFTKMSCLALGSNAPLYRGVKDSSYSLMVLASGEPLNREATEKEKDILGERPGESLRLLSNRADVTSQATAAAHELTHVAANSGHGGGGILSFLHDSGDLNAYVEGDDSHEITTWFLNGEDGKSPENFDMEGHSAPSPELGLKIRKLTQDRLLPPLLSVKDR